MISDLKFIDSNTGWIAGYQDYYFNPNRYKGKVFKSIDGGINWLEQYISYPANRKRMYSIEIVDLNTGYVSGDSNTVIKTTNGGNTWFQLSTPVISTARYRWYMCFIDANTGWISSTTASALSRTYQTTNGGLTWSGVNNSGFSKLSFINSSTGFAFNGTGLFKTTDGGYNWNNVILDSLIADFYFLNNNTGWCYSGAWYYSNHIKGKGWKTTNSGNNWNVLYTNDSLNWLYRIKFFDENSGYAGNYLSVTGLAKTTNGGITWFNPFNLRYLIYNPYFINSNTGWGGLNPLYKTTTGPGNFYNPFFANLGPVYQNSNNMNNRFNENLISYYDTSDGLEWPKNSGKHILYSAGLNIGAKVNGQLRVAHSLYSGLTDWKRGYVDNSVLPQGFEQAEYGIYQIKTGDGPGIPDWDNWPVNQGAPTINGQPMLIGNQTSFVSLTDGYGGSYFSQPLFAEVKMLTYSINQPVPYDDIIFMKFDIKNRSGIQWDSTYITILFDSDVGYGDDDRMGSDSILNLSYAYNATNFDNIYGANPPAFGIKLLQGGPFNKPTSSVVYYNGGPNCYRDPSNADELYNFMKGFNSCGQPYMYNNIPKKFVFDGDPETNTGWIANDAQDVRNTLSVGPLTLAYNQSTTILIALIAARGTSNVNSVTKLKQIAGQLPIAIQTNTEDVPGKFSLSQNYPNPFNPTTKIRFSLPTPSEGGTQAVKLIIYDILGREIAILVNEQLQPGTYEVDWDGTNYPSGVYFYTLNTNDYKETKRMVLIK